MLRRGEINIIHLQRDGTVLINGVQYPWKKFVRFVDESTHKVAWLEVLTPQYGVEWTAEDSLRWPSLYSRLDILLYRMELMNAPFLRLRVWFDPFATTSHTWNAIETIENQIKHSGEVLTSRIYPQPGDAIFIESEDLIK